MGASKWTYINVKRIVRETDKAFLCEMDEGQLWIPKSQIADSGDYEQGDEDVELGITEWFAERMWDDGD